MRHSTIIALVIVFQCATLASGDSASPYFSWDTVPVYKGWPDLTFNWTNKEKMRVPSNVLADEARKKIIFSLACFLIGAQENCYFSYSWGWREKDGSLIDYPEFHKPLGKPKGRAERKEWIYTRSYEHASVWVDLAERKAKIDWK